MSITIERDDWYRKNTEVENIFINEFMTRAPGDCVKVYLYALMKAQLGEEAENAEIAEALSLDEEDVRDAWNYWEEQGACEKVGDSIRLLILKNGGHEKKESGMLADEEMKYLFTGIEDIVGKPLNGTEMNAVKEWMNNMHAEADIILYAYEYCSSRNKTDYRYVGKVIENWLEKGYSTSEEIEKHLGEFEEKRSLYREIFNRMGFNRNWTVKEQEMMDTWIDEWGFSIERILEACDKSAGIPNPNLNYVNSVLSNWNEEVKDNEFAGKKISVSQVIEYYEFLRAQEEKEALVRRAEVYEAVPEIKLFDDKIKDESARLPAVMLSRDENLKNQIKNTIEELNMERAVLLTENNYPLDYMDVRYLCRKCKDTGIDEDGNRCSCFEDRSKEAVEWLKNRNRNTKE